jgi:hypothetical protein
MCAAHIGDSICCGRGSGDIWSCLNQVRSLMPVFRPKAMVVTIGGNNREPAVSLETVKGLYQKFLFMAEHWGAVLILNTIPICPRDHIAETNRIIRSLGVMGSRFDLVLTENHAEDGKQLLNYYVADQTHLNPEGNRKLYHRFMKDFSWLRNW